MPDKIADKPTPLPLASPPPAAEPLPEVEAKSDPAPEPAPEPVVSDAPAAEQLAAAHDKYLGADVPLIDGKPEKGIGSKYHGLHHSQKAHITAIEHLMAVEKEAADAEAHMASINVKLDYAKKRVAATEASATEVEPESK